MRSRHILLSFVLLPLAACTAVDTGFGEAQRWDMAQQVIDPDPVYDDPGRPIEGSDGVKAEGALERYHTDKVKQPSEVGTRTATSGGGNGPR